MGGGLGLWLSPLLNSDWLTAGAGAGDPGGVRSGWGVGGSRLELGLSWEFVSGGTQGRELCAPPGTGNFSVLDPLFPRLAGRADSPGCAGWSVWRPCFSWVDCLGVRSSAHSLSEVRLGK